MRIFILVLFLNFDEFMNAFINKNIIGRASKSIRLSTVNTQKLESEQLKRQLKDVLKTCKGLTKSPEVMAVIDQLQTINPTINAASSPLLLGNFISLSAPDYPGSIGQNSDGLIGYTLGRIAFNMFKPVDILCYIEKTCQPITPIANSKSEFRYDIEIYLILKCDEYTDDDDDGSSTALKAVIVNDAICSPSTKEGCENRLDVFFKGGRLSPVSKNSLDMSLWKRIFNTTDELSFRMDKSPAGYLDILYLDDTMRITRGNFGSVVVVERV